MSINIEKTVKAYESIGNIEWLTKMVHEYVLVSGWVDTHEKPIRKAIEQCGSHANELLYETLIGMLIKRMPKLHMGTKLDDDDNLRARAIAAKLLVHCFIDNEEFDVDTRVESNTVNGHKKFHTRLYIQFGESTFKKNLLKGISDKPGVVNQKEVNGWVLPAAERAFLRKVGSIPFVISEVCSEVLLMKGYSLKTDWNKTIDKNGKRIQEDPIMKKKRYAKYAGVIMNEVASMSCFYLSMKYCDRKRVYYEAASLDGMRVHGKLWETLMIDAAVPFDLTEEDERVLKHIIYVVLHGRVSVNRANHRFSVIDMLSAECADPMVAESEEEFGLAILLNKAAMALMQYQNGQTSTFMFGYDFTNSGLLMSGVSFRSEKMMKAGNIGGDTDTVYDSHTEFGKGYEMDLDRKDIKKIHMPMMHGASLNSTAKTITEIVGHKVTEDDVAASNERAYGTPAANISKIADFGAMAVGDKQTVLRWTLPDGFSASSRAYYESVPLLTYSASAAHDKGYTGGVLVMDMPWGETKDGYPLYAKEVQVGGSVYTVKQHKRGLFASITHGIDAYTLRQVVHAVIDSGRPILLKHDDYMCPPSGRNVVEKATKAVFKEMFCTNMYQSAIDEIIAESPYDIPPMHLVLGDADIAMIDQSCNFLMPG
jgi:hypothetical protein